MSDHPGVDVLLRPLLVLISTAAGLLPAPLDRAERRALAQGRLVAPADRGCIGLHVRPEAGSPYVQQRARRGRAYVGTAFCGGPVRAVRDGWVRATIAALRPGAPGVTGWAHVKAADLRVVPHTIVVHRGRREVVVRDARRIVRRFRVGVGAPDTPTTLGTTSVAARLRYRPSDPGYAAYGPHLLALALPAADGPRQNPVFRGRGVLAFHAGAPTGSHGCIHVLPADMRWLWRHVRAGTRVRILR